MLGRYVLLKHFTAVCIVIHSVKYDILLWSVLMIIPFCIIPNNRLGCVIHEIFKNFDFLYITYSFEHG
jgi:hypothetical protein